MNLLFTEIESEIKNRITYDDLVISSLKNYKIEKVKKQQKEYLIFW